MLRYTQIFAALVIGGSSFAMIAAAPPVDSNGDGIVTRAEFNKAAISKFEAADSNSDGFWTVEEMRDVRHTRKLKSHSNLAMQGMYGSSLISKKEDTEQSLRHSQMRDRVNAALRSYGFSESLTFASMDKDGSGHISAEERAEIIAEFRQNRERIRRGYLGRMDRDADGQISQDEYMMLSDERFGSFDKNNDGQLSSDESTGREIIMDSSQVMKQKTQNNLRG